MRVKKEFQIYSKTHRSGNVAWVVSLGMVNGKRKFKSCSSLEEAQQFKAKCEEKDALKNPTALSDLDELGKASIRHALEKLKPFDATITEAVDFFIKFAKPPKGKVTIQEAMDLFASVKTAEGLSKTYLEKSRRCFFVPFRDAMKNCLMNDVTPTRAHDYIYRKDNWNKTTKNTHLRHLRALYGFVMKKGHATFDPFASVPFAKDKGSKVEGKVLSVADAEQLLRFALEASCLPECASMALVLFCGVRVDEVERVSWEAVKLDAPKPHVDLRETKNGHRRINHLSDNAMIWLKRCRSTGCLAPDNYTRAMQRLRRKANVDYRQNAARISFASYHLAAFEDAPKTAIMLGHPNPSLLYRTYRELETKEDAELYWNIVPKDVAVRQEEEKARKDAVLKRVKQRSRNLHPPPNSLEISLSSLFKSARIAAAIASLSM